MTTTPTAAIQPASLPDAPAAIFAVLGLIDIALLGVIGSSIAPPLALSIFLALLGLVTLLAVVPARRGSRRALITAVAARAVSAVLAFGAFFNNAPAWIMATEGIVIVATIVAIVLLRRQPRPQVA